MKSPSVGRRDQEPVAGGVGGTAPVVAVVGIGRGSASPPPARERRIPVGAPRRRRNPRGDRVSQKRSSVVMRTYVDSGVLIAAARGSGRLGDARSRSSPTPREESSSAAITSGSK